MKQALVLDDDLVGAEVIALRLRKKGYQTRIAHSLADALQILKNGVGADFVVTDIVLPDGRGDDLIEFIRSQANLQRTPILVVSGYIGPRQINDLLILGASRCLCKPLNPKMFDEYVDLLEPNLMEVQCDELWNKVDALQRFDGDTTLLAGLVEATLSDAAARISRLSSALKTSDRYRAIAEAHSLESAFGHLGATGVGRVAAQTKRQIKQLTQIESLSVEALEKAIHAFGDCVKKSL